MKIGIIGAIGVDDIGDVIMLESALMFIDKISREKNIKIKPVIFSMDNLKTENQINKFDIEVQIENVLSEDRLMESYENFNFDNFINNDIVEFEYKNKEYTEKIIDCQGLFFIGGGYFNKYWGDKLISNFAIPLALAYKHNIPVFISGVSIGPFDEKDILSFKGLFKGVDTIILRDRYDSPKFIEKLGGTDGEIVLGADDILPRWYNKKQCSMKKELEKSRFAVIQLHHYVETYSENYINFYKKIATFFNYLIDNNYLDKVYFLPFDYYKGVDYECGRRLSTFLDNREEYVVLEPTDNHIYMRTLICKSKFVIASRYHPVVFALGEDIPVLGICTNGLYMQKLSGAFDVVGLNSSDNIFKISDLSADKMVLWYTNMVLNKHSRLNNNIVTEYKNIRETKMEDFFNNIVISRETMEHKECNK